MIEIVTSPTCAPCRTLKMYLDRKNVEYTEIDSESDKAQELFNEAGGRILPLTVVNGKYFVRGLNIQNLNRVLERW